MIWHGSGTNKNARTSVRAFLLVGRTLHHANHPTTILSSPLSGPLTSSRGMRGAT